MPRSRITRRAPPRTASLKASTNVAPADQNAPECEKAGLSVGREGGKWSLGFFSEAMNVCVKHD